jgi:uncharacterized protein YuzE
MHVNYSPKEDAMYIRFSEADYAGSQEVQDGVIFDLDKSGAIAGLELLNVSTKIPHLNTNEFKYEITPESK